MEAKSLCQLYTGSVDMIQRKSFIAGMDVGRDRPRVRAVDYYVRDPHCTTGSRSMEWVFQEFVCAPRMEAGDPRIWLSGNLRASENAQQNHLTSILPQIHYAKLVAGEGTGNGRRRNSCKAVKMTWKAGAQAAKGRESFGVGQLFCSGLPRILMSCVRARAPVGR
jgi:hypothetical protein